MRKSFFIIATFGLLTRVVTAQGPQTADQPSLPSERTSPYSYGGEAGMEGGYGRGEGNYGGGGYGRGGYAATSDPRATRQLIDRWKASREASERDKIETTLRDTLKKEFDARLAAHEKEIKELEEKVRQLRARLNLRREKQDEIVDHRLQQILREAQGLGWGSEGNGGGMRGQARYGDLFYPMTEYAPADALQPATTSALAPAEVDDSAATSTDSAPAVDEAVLSPARN